jgi:serine/threonine-protein kinase
MMPTKIGRYQIKTEIGRGGMATVYLAHDPRFNRVVTIKLLPHELLHQPTFRARFEREAKIVAALDIPSIVPVYDYGEEDGQPYLVMRYMSGGTLAERLERGAISLPETARIISALATAMDEAHSQGFIHRDIKPSNVLFDHRGNPFVSDFGTALIIQSSIKLTDTGGAVGTPAYMSPEQIRGERALDGRSDLYALGIITYEMLSGKHPYQTNTPIGMAVRHIIDPVPRILDSNPNLPPYCQAIITRALAKNREDRFPTATDYAQALSQAALTHVTALSGRDGHGSNFWGYGRTPWQQNKRKQIIWVAAMLVLALLLIGGGRINWNSTPTPKGTTVLAANPEVESTPILSPAPTEAIVPTQPAVETAAIPPTKTRAIKPMETAVTNDERPINLNAPQSASLFAQPDATSTELAIIKTDDPVSIAGRSENGHWLYIYIENNTAGYVWADQFGWSGDVAQLPVIMATATSVPVVTTDANNSCPNGCARLWLDAYPLPDSRCEGSTVYKTVFLRGQGGSGVYTYYWNGKKVAGPLTNDGYGFEVNNINGTVIGQAKVVSSDGQTAEKELFISDFKCE